MRYSKNITSESRCCINLKFLVRWPQRVLTNCCILSNLPDSTQWVISPGGDQESLFFDSTQSHLNQISNQFIFSFRKCQLVTLCVPRTLNTLLRSFTTCYFPFLYPKPQDYLLSIFLSTLESCILPSCNWRDRFAIVMCERCTIIECAFGSRDPLPPRIASLDADYHNPPAIEVEEAKPKGVHHNRANHLGSPGDTTPALQTSASTSSGTCNSALVILQRGEAVGPSATTAAAPASAPSAHVKWSDVVDLGSEAFQPRAISSPGDFAVAMPYSILLTITKNADILDALLLNCPDFATLFALVASCHTAKNAFERHPQGIIKAMLGRMPQELQYLTVALIGMNGTQVGDSESIKTLMETWLGMGPKPLTERLQVGISGTSLFLCKSSSWNIRSLGAWKGFLSMLGSCSCCTTTWLSVIEVAF